MLGGANLVIVTASVPERIGAIAQAAIEVGCDWIDTLLSTRPKLAALRALEPAIRGRGLCFVTDGGFHPGLPAAMVRWVAERLDTVGTAEVFAALRIDWRADEVAASTMREFASEFGEFDMRVNVDGAWKVLRWRDCPVHDFGAPFGQQTCVPMPLDEMEALPALVPGLRRTGFFIAGFGPVMDYIVSPAVMALARMPRQVGLGAAAWLLQKSLATFGRAAPPYAITIVLRAEGTRDGQPATATMTLRYHDAYHVTAVPVVACWRQLAEGGARRAGVWHQGCLVEPEAFFQDLQANGLHVESTAGASA